MGELETKEERENGKERWRMKNGRKLNQFINNLKIKQKT